MQLASQAPAHFGRESNPVIKKPAFVILCCVALWTIPSRSQTFEINGQPSQPAATSPNGQQAQAKRGSQAGSSNPSGDTGIGWGSSIEVGRLARGAEDSLRRGNYAQAADYAQRAVNAAPGDNKLWFLLGYASRMAGQYNKSVEAYQHGLQMSPGNADGLSGLAQTYARLGKTDEAKRLLTQVVSAHPDRTNDLLVLGEMYMHSGETQRAVDMLQRAENQQPNAHVELMLAIGYLKLKQPDRAKQMLDTAKKHAPGSVEIFQAAATYYREEHDYKAAIDTLKSAPKMTPSVLADLGYSYELDGDKQGAADAYSRAANADAKNIGYQLSAAQALLRAGELEKTKSFLNRAAAIDSNHYRLHATRGLLAKTENRDDEAIREYNAAIAALPPGTLPEGDLYPVQLRLNLADLYREAGDEKAAHETIAQAEDEINKLNVEGPAKAEFLRIRAALKTSDNDFKGAEADLLQAQQLDAQNTNIKLQYANLLWKEKRKDESRKIYEQILSGDPNNRFALEAMGYLYREDNHPQMAEQYFNRMAAAYPDDYVPYLALGDLYTQVKQFDQAETAYEKAIKIAPQNPVVISNAANAAIENGQIKLAGQWVNRAQGKTNDDPRVMRERERWLFHEGKYEESARLGYKVMEELPKDRNASVYLAYDLYNLGRYDEVLRVVNKYQGALPKEPNFPLLAGHVHKQSQLLFDSVNDYTDALARDPKMAEAYVNRGYVLNDMQNAEAASQDFHTALKLNPNNGIAHLGLAFSDLQLRRPKDALTQVDTAQKLMGESGATHLVKATAYRQQRLLGSAEKEYTAALKYAPDDIGLQLARADTLYRMKRYQESIDALNQALRLSPDDPFLYAEMAHAYAEMHNREETVRYVQAAEERGAGNSVIMLDTGDALLTLGDEKAAMDRFAQALAAPDANRVEVRLAIARVMASQGHYDDAKQQISLGFAESRIGEAPPVTSDNLIEAANLLLAMHDFDLAENYYEKAKQAGAADEVVSIGLANSYLAQGKTRKAEAELATLGADPANNENYDYLLAQSTVYRQRNNNVDALAVLSRANALSTESEDAARVMEQVAGDEGYRINDHLSLLANFTMGGLYDDSTIYMLDQQIFGLNSNSSLLPPPRSQLESIGTAAYRLHFNNFPLVSGFFQLRNASGPYSLPQEALIINRNTFDYTFNSALNPVLHVGDASINFNAGIQYTLQRDQDNPVLINQNLLREFGYFSSSSFFNWISANGMIYHEGGPFTMQDLNSSDVGGRLEFRVGRPWGKTAFIAGYTRRNLTFHPLPRQFFTTSTYAGIQRKFGEKFTVTALGEYIRSYRVQDSLSAIAQALRPGGTVEYRPARAWSVNGEFAYTRGEILQDYNNYFIAGFVSYERPLRRIITDSAGSFPVDYPLRFSFGFETEQFPNFNGAVKSATMVRPIVRLTVF
jgi:tetratricopeptide (TPR) repeat protein